MSTEPTIIESLVKVLVVDARKRGLVLILGKHMKYPEKSFLPDLPGGIVDPGEPELTATIREVREECGFELDARDVRLVYTETAFYEKENKTVSKLFYIAHIETTPEIILSWEHSDHKWVSVDELNQVELRPFFKQAIEYSIKHSLV